MTDFYPGVTPQDLIPGDPDELLGLCGSLNTLADGFNTAGTELQRISTGSWQGDAAEAFQQTIGQQPTRYFTAAQSFSLAATAISRYAAVLEACQQAAARAIASYEDAQTASAGWQQRKTIAHAAGHPFVESDPGDAGRAQAEASLGEARSLLDQAAGTAGSSLSSAESTAPHKPGFFSSLLHKVEHPLHTYESVRNTVVSGATSAGKWTLDQAGGLAKDVVDDDLKTLKLVGINPEGWSKDLWAHTPGWGRSFLSGVGDGTVEMGAGLYTLGKFGYSLSPTRLESDPLGYLSSVKHDAWVAAGIGKNVRRDPVGFSKQFGSALIDLDEWKKDPAKAIGELAPAVVVAVATAGMGSAADAATQSALVAERLEAGAELMGNVGYAERFGEIASTRTAQAQNIEHQVALIKKTGAALDAQGTAQAAQNEPSHSADGHVAGMITERVSKRMLPLFGG